MFDESYDVVVVGAGHAGCEARTLLRNWDAIPRSTP
jgi:tRNA U34 5-carboxymethylaminomethyl modifying enzyme MnmG/GidA